MSKSHHFVLALAFLSVACAEEGSSPARESAPLSHADQAPGQTGNTPGQSGQTPGQGNAPPPGQVGATPHGGGSSNTDLCAGTSCDDANPCTADTCDPATGCAHAALADGVVVDATPTSCGVGACGATGQTVCSGGAPVDSCTPGAPAASDATCDGVDDDCNGAVDDGYVSRPTSCGAGACAATGSMTCVGGVEVDTCTPGAGPCEAPTVILTTTPPATTSNTRADFVWTYASYSSWPTSIRYTVSYGYDSGVTTPLNTAFSVTDLSPGTYTFSITATNSAGSSTTSYTWTVTPPPVGGARIVGWSSYDGLQTTGLDGVASSLSTADTQIAQWSPDGQHIAYRRTSVRELWVERADGTNKLNLSSGTGGVAIDYFAWSPDSTKLVFDVISGGYTDVWVVNADGTGLRNLTATPSASEEQASFTPDGRIVYRNGDRSIWTMNADGTAKARLIATTSTDPVLGRALFSPDGRFVYAVSFSGELLRYNADGTGRTPISGGPVSYTEYALSPDGRRVSFLRNNQVWVIENADGAATLRQLSTQSSGAGSAYQITTWSSDGATVVFDCNSASGSGTNLCRVDANTTAPTAASFVGSGQFQFPHWSGYNPARGG